MIVVFTLALSLGLHWVLLQSVAWVGMVVSYAEKAPLKEALVKTFDGKHPCALCKIVQKGAQSPQKPGLHKLQTKLDLVLFAKPDGFLPPLFPPQLGTSDEGPKRCERPPVPPPKPA
jgi:hypothetical protein